MRSAYEILGIEPRLDFDDTELAAAFRAAGATVHPDAGGVEEDFAELRGAMEILGSPSKRVRHWLELRGVEIDARGSVEDSLMDLFSEVDSVIRRCEALDRRRSETRSALALAMCEAETQVCREALESSLATVDAAIGDVCAGFPELERNADAEVGSRTVRTLAFLEKWRSLLRSWFARLV